MILLALAMVVGALAYRANGRRAYQREVAARQALGRPGTLDELLSITPAVDHLAQDAWDVWQKSASASWTDPHYDTAAWNAWITGTGPFPDSVATTCAARLPRMDPALALLDRGNLLLGVLGWAAIDLPPGKRGLDSLTDARHLDLIAVRDLGDWLRYMAVLGTDPQPSLRRLDALQTATGILPGNLIDAMIALVVCDIRDRTYLELALRGTLSETDRERWLSESSHALRLVADGYEGEACLFVGGTAVSLDDSTWRSSQNNLPRRVSDFWISAMWVTGFQDCAIMASVECQVADRLRGLRSDSPPTHATLKPRLGILAQVALPNLLECRITALDADSRHRMARLAVRLLVAAHATGLPADLENPEWQAALRPAGDHLWLRYERLADDRFRLTIDPTSPIPNFYDPLRLTLSTSHAGTPPATAPPVWRRGHCVEVLIPTKR